MCFVVWLTLMTESLRNIKLLWTYTIHFLNKLFTFTYKQLCLQGYLQRHAFWQFHAYVSIQAQIDAEMNGIQCSSASAWLAPCLHQMQAAQQNTIEPIIISDAV